MARWSVKAQPREADFASGAGVRIDEHSDEEFGSQRTGILPQLPHVGILDGSQKNHYSSGPKLMKRQANNPMQEVGSGFWCKADKTLRHHGGQVLRLTRVLRWDIQPRLAERPVFVVGCSRGGTTLVYRTFSESRDLGSLERETHDYWGRLHPIEERGWRSHALGAADASNADRLATSRLFYVGTGRRRFVDKNNQNGLAIPYLHALFPDAHFVYIKRSPGDNINSLIEGWGRAEAFGAWSQDLPRAVAVDGGRYRRWCFFLAEGWEHYLEAPIESVCAFQYRAMNQAILDAFEGIPAPQWTEICYEDVLADPVACFRQAFINAGLQFDAPLASHCTNVLARPYNAFSEIRKDKWRDGPHAAKIERILPEVAGVAGRMGY